MDRGYVKFWRKSLDSGFLQNPNLFTFWSWCLLKASHKRRKQMVGMELVELSPGDFVFGRKSASVELKMSEQTIRTCLKKLKKLENLTTKVTNKFTLISIVNWDTYQDDKKNITTKVTNSQPASNQQVTSSQPASNHKQECKHVSIKALDTKDLSDSIEPETKKEGHKKKKGINYTEEFEAFYSQYPRKTNKGAALKAFNNILDPVPTSNELKAAIETAKTCKKWQDPQYIPHPATWLNARGWEDEITTEQKQESKWDNF